MTPTLASARRCGSRRRAAGAGSGGCSRRPNCAVKVKVLPRPGWFSTVTVPPISPASRAAIVSPSPVPPYLCVVELSSLLERPEVRFLLLRRDADARICHGEAQSDFAVGCSLTIGLHAYDHLRLLGELDGIADVSSRSPSRQDGQHTTHPNPDGSISGHPGKDVTRRAPCRSRSPSPGQLLIALDSSHRARFIALDVLAPRRRSTHRKSGESRVRAPLRSGTSSSITSRHACCLEDSREVACPGSFRRLIPPDGKGPLPLSGSCPRRMRWSGHECDTLASIAVEVHHHHRLSTLDRHRGQT